MALASAKIGARKFGWHSGSLECYNVTVNNDLTVNGNFSFGDASTDNLTVNGDLIIADDKKLHFGTDEDASIEYDENGGNVVTVTGADWLLGTTVGITFRDSALKINSSTDGQLDIVADTTVAISGAVTTDGDVTIGDAVTDTLVLNGRVATGSTSGAYLDIDSTATTNELFEIKADVSDWTNIPVNYDSQQQYIGGYFRAQSAVDDTEGWLIGLQGWGVSNGAGHSELTGVFGYAYAKGDTTDTIGEAYGIRGEFSMDAGRANTLTLTTRAAGVLSYITSGKVDDYTNIHGFVGSFGDMDGGSRVYGDGLLLIDGPESGTCTLTNGINLSIGCTTGINFGTSVTTEVIMATQDSGSLPCIIRSGTATDDAGIVSDVGADALWADGSIYISVVDGAGKIFQKQNDVWVDLQA